MALTKQKPTLKEIPGPVLFFALTLLVVQAVFGGVIAYTRMPPTLTFAAICAVAFLFLLMAGFVASVTIYRPLHHYELVRRAMKSTDPLAIIIAAFDMDAKEWRTSFGLAEELGLSESTVEQTIREHPDLFRRATVAPAGFALYRPRRRPRQI